MDGRVLALALAVLAPLCACRGTPSEPGEPADGAGGPIVLEGPSGLDLTAGVAPEHQSALEAIERAVSAGEDEAARAILDRLLARGPEGKTLALAQSFERILDGRAGVRALSMRLEARPVPGTQLAGAPSEAQAWQLLFVAHNTSPERLLLRPGPATLATRSEGVSPRGAEESSAQTRNYERLEKLELEPGATRESELARFFLAPSAERVGVRMSFELELRSGVIVRAGRELPAMRLAVTPAEASAWWPGTGVGGVSGGSAPSELFDLARAPRAGSDPLALAVRLPAAERASTLAGLAGILAEASRPELERWTPALRWLSLARAPTDADRLRTWLADEAARADRRRPRPALVLPGAREGAQPPSEP